MYCVSVHPPRAGNFGASEVAAYTAAGPGGRDSSDVAPASVRDVLPPLRAVSCLDALTTTPPFEGMLASPFLESRIAQASWQDARQRRRSTEFIGRNRHL